MLFSGPGRHRRPTQADRTIAAAGVAGAGMALPLLAATAAHAASPATWDAVAQCESGGDWNAGGDGFHGGLQISQRTWVAYGGYDFALQPEHATREQQITVAERVLAEQGPSAWSTCATTAGLTGGPAPAPTPATTAPAAPPIAAPLSTLFDLGIPVDLDSGMPLPSTQHSPAQAPEAMAPTGNPVFTGQPGWDQAQGVYWYQKGGSWHWTTHLSVYQNFTGPNPPLPVTNPVPYTQPQSPVTQPAPAPTADTPLPQPTAQPTTPVTTPTAPTAPTTPATSPAPSATTPPTTAAQTPPAATPAPGQPPTQPQPQSSYTVHSGDSLSAIAQSQHLPGWQGLYDTNRTTVGDNPDLIHPGQVLKVHD